MEGDMMVLAVEPTIDRSFCFTELPPLTYVDANHTEPSYHRSRSYNPETGRFSRLDPLSGLQKRPLSFNTYLYAEANPINGIDPSGNRTLVGTLAVSGIVGILISTTIESISIGIDAFNGNTPELDDILKRLGKAALVGAASGLAGGYVGSILTKAIGSRVAIGALTGASAAFVGQSVSELYDFFIYDKPITVSTGGRIFTATFGGLVTGGFLSFVTPAFRGRPVRGNEIAGAPSNLGNSRIIPVPNFGADQSRRLVEKAGLGLLELNGGLLGIKIAESINNYLGTNQ